jgi:hypothetical protein
MTRPIFIVHLRPEADCPDHIKALRAVLKRSLRDYGMRCVTIQSTDSVGIVLPEEP